EMSKGTQDAASRPQTPHDLPFMVRNDQRRQSTGAGGPAADEVRRRCEETSQRPPPAPRATSPLAWGGDVLRVTSPLCGRRFGGATLPIAWKGDLLAGIPIRRRTVAGSRE